jgi:hypothetical protein
MAKDANDLIKKFRRETRRPSWPRVIPPEEMPPWPIGRVITPDMFEAADWLEQHQDQRHTKEYCERLRWLAEAARINPIFCYQCYLRDRHGRLAFRC